MFKKAWSSFTGAAVDVAETVTGAKSLAAARILEQNEKRLVAAIVTRDEVKAKCEALNDQIADFLITPKPPIKPPKHPGVSLFRKDALLMHRTHKPKKSLSGAQVRSIGELEELNRIKRKLCDQMCAMPKCADINNIKDVQNHTKSLEAYFEEMSQCFINCQEKSKSCDAGIASLDK